VVSEFETLLYDERDGVAYVTMNRPERLNAFNFQMQTELRDVYTSLRHNDDVRAVVLTGAGEKAFCTGIDRDESVGDFVEKHRAGVNRVGSVSTPIMFDDPGKNICPKQLDLWKPVIAAVNGMACGGALYMLGEVDIIIAAENATFFDPHVTYNMVSGFEAMHLLQKLPLGETIRLALLGAHERISAQRAFDVGLVSEVVPLADLADRARWIAESIATADPQVIQATLQAIWTAHELGRTQALALAHTFVGLGNTTEGLTAGQEFFASGKRVDWQVR
jgi:enoyl-CoA hydratase/carnithine racemase